MPLSYQLEIPMGLAVTNDDQLSSVHEMPTSMNYFSLTLQLLMSNVAAQALARQGSIGNSIS